MSSIEINRMGAVVIDGVYAGSRADAERNWPDLAEEITAAYAARSVVESTSGGAFDPPSTGEITRPEEALAAATNS